MQSSWKKLNKFSKQALFYSYSLIGSHSQLFPAVKHPVKINLPNVDYFSTWQFDLYDKSDGNPSEIQGTTHCRAHHWTQCTVQPNERRSLPRLSCNVHAHSAFCLVTVAVWQLFSCVNPTAIVSDRESNEGLAAHKKLPFKLKLGTQSCSIDCYTVTCIHVSKYM